MVPGETVEIVKGVKQGERGVITKSRSWYFFVKTEDGVVQEVHRAHIRPIEPTERGMTRG
jgi:hypothetical protein